MPPLSFRSIWISDVHLGTRHLRADSLLHFLRSTESEYLYLVGDIFDIWQLKNRWYWSAVHDQIVSTVLDKAAQGTNVYYLPGNHDESLRRFEGTSFSGVTISSKLVHETAGGSSYLVMHGDSFDCVVQNNKWLADIGSSLYGMILNVNHWYNLLRLKFGKEYWSLSAFLKHKVKDAVNYIGRYEDVLVSEIRANKVDGLICGHIHHASIKMMDGFLYSNAGDWVESCTALAENQDGTLGLIEWSGSDPVTELVNSGYEKNTCRDRCLAPTN
ncbi:MAG: UDP-2,3-diacylglucosamine diphosphatase [Thermodesulfobacteriota bacterium]|nr:UDP-2,3-diacylglucosamine diphosphatase [Thermodesulfobacteriota bacterium]